MGDLFYFNFNKFRMSFQNCNLFTSSLQSKCKSLLLNSFQNDFEFIPQVEFCCFVLPFVMHEMLKINEKDRRNQFSSKMNHFIYDLCLKCESALNKGGKKDYYLFTIDK